MYDPSGVQIFNKIYYRIMINGKTFLSEKSNISIPIYTGGETCVKVKSIYDIGYNSFTIYRANGQKKYV